MTCKECEAEMLLGETGWSCPNGHGRIIPCTDRMNDVANNQKQVVKHRPLSKRLDEFDQGVKGLDEKR